VRKIPFSKSIPLRPLVVPVGEWHIFYYIISLYHKQRAPNTNLQFIPLSFWYDWFDFHVYWRWWVYLLNFFGRFRTRLLNHKPKLN